MQAEIASPPPVPRLLSLALAARLALPVTIFLTLLVELALAERKYALFGGGFGQSRALDGPLEAAAFAAAVLLCQTVIFLGLYRLLRRLHRRNGDSPFFLFNFAFFVGGGAVALLVAKYQALAFFSDAMSFQIVRNLGGGSLVDAAQYSLSEAGLIAMALLGAAACYAIALFSCAGAGATPPPFPTITGRANGSGCSCSRRRRCSCSQPIASTMPAPRRRGSTASSRSPLCFTKRAISTATAGACSLTRSTGGRSTAAAIPMRSTCPATASTRTAMAATSPSPARPRPGRRRSLPAASAT